MAFRRCSARAPGAAAVAEGGGPVPWRAHRVRRRRDRVRSDGDRAPGRAAVGPLRDRRAGGGPQRLTHGARAGDPDVSPDGRVIVCTIQRADRRELATLSLPAARPRARTARPARRPSPASIFLRRAGRPTAARSRPSACRSRAVRRSCSSIRRAAASCARSPRRAAAAACRRRGCPTAACSSRPTAMATGFASSSPTSAPRQTCAARGHRRQRRLARALAGWPHAGVRRLHA